jgi:uncharacterized protein YndB with AHSA1/START domain
MQAWTDERSIDIQATPLLLWRLFSDVEGWPQWNAGIEHIQLHGPFASGTRFTMQPPGEDAFASTLLEVRENQGFSDETILHGTRVVVHHAITPLAGGSTRIVFRSEVTGPVAADLGEAVTEDFCEVLAALKRRAER